MKKDIINIEDGSFNISDAFGIYTNTTISALQTYFSKERLKLTTRNEYANLSIYDLKIKDWYFIIVLYFKNEKLTHLNFYPRDEEKNTSTWDNFDPIKEREYYTQWMAAQIGDKSQFKWDMNQAGRHYSFSYTWGAVGVYYDFKGGTFNCIMSF